MDSLDALFCYIDDFCWFFGFKLHLVVNDRGELLNIQVTPGNTDDRKPVDDLLKDLYGKVFADRGYVSKALAQRLFESYGIEFFAKPKRNMKNHLMWLTDKLLARKRAIAVSSGLADYRVNTVTNTVLFF